MTKNNVNIDDVLRENYVVPESVFDNRRTKTSHFMLNTLFPPKASIMSIDYFVNAFLDDEGYPHQFIRPIFLLFKVPKADTKWSGMIAPRMRQKSEYVMEYLCGVDSEGAKLIMMVFRVPLKWAKEYIHFKSGKYSSFSDEYKSLFNRYAHDEKAQPIESVIWQAMNKSEKLRDKLQDWIGRDSDDYVFTEEDELWGIPTPLFEHYRHKPTEEDKWKKN